MPVVRRSKLSRFVVAGIATAGIAFAGCSTSGSSDSIQVFAAASLTNAFEQLEKDFEEANPGTDVVLNLAGSSSLREQIRSGAPADVIATANEQVVRSLADEGLLATDPTVFASNSLVIAVPLGNPGGVTAPSDLGDDALLVGVCAAAVPCGSLAVETLAAVGVEVSADTNEPDVRALLTKIELGELDAGLVYVTDALALSGRVESIDIGLAEPLVTRYPVASVADAPNPDGAAAFVDFVLSAGSSQVFADFGFGAPE